MAWKSASFQHRDVSKKAVEQVVKTIEKHRGALNIVIEQARQLQQDRKETVDKIDDPQLRKSALR